MGEYAIKNQPLLCKIINNINKYNKHAHAYILVSDSKEELNFYSKNLAKILICPKKYTNNCNLCNICARIDKNEYSELKIIDPVNKVIKKEEILNLRTLYQNSFIESKNGVYIINDAECLNNASSNSMLKFLEEPDNNIVGIFTTTNIDSVMDTIVSRCQIIKIKSSSSEKGIEFVEKVSNLSDDSIYAALKYIQLVESNYEKALVNLKPNLLDIFNTKELLSSAMQVFLLYYKDLLNYILNNKTVYFDNLNIKAAENQEIVIKKISFTLENISKLDYNVNINLFINNYLIGIEAINNDKSNRN